jgi:YD repeat-containing protein
VEKDLTGITDDENKDFTYSYDATGNLVQFTDNSPNARVKTYAITYNGLN